LTARIETRRSKIRPRRIMTSMIARIHGVLEALEGSTALIGAGGGLTYQVLLPAYTASRLGASIGRPVTLHTLHWLESQDQGSSMTPRLAGFLSEEDRRFFELFTTCKGLGRRRALRAMAMDTARIAAAIADRDLPMLQSLPEIGRRLAETLVATLHGKVDGFVSAAAFGDKPADAGSSRTAGDGSLAREALQALLQLGEDRLTAVSLIDRALADPEQRPRTVQQLLTRVYALKAGG
jgi:Holliday junction DNA helicase RuvA